MTNLRRIAISAAAATAFAVLPAAASAADGPCYNPPAKPKVISHVTYKGMQSKLYCFGPMTIKPGQNTIEYPVSNLHPDVPGWITRFDPDFIYADPKKGNKGVPGVDVLHLHHAVWLFQGEQGPRWASGEEKTVIQLPKGFGWRNDPNKTVIVNNMIHNLFPTTEKVYLTWRIDFVPDTAADASQIVEAKTLWMDTAGFAAYPVFNALRQFGTNGKFTFPDDVSKISNPTLKAAETAKIGSAHRFTVPSTGMTLMGTIGHLHPGGLQTQLKVTRNGVTKTLFTSQAKYWEPAGAVSWDVAMTATPSTWRIKLKPGDVITTNATYNVSKASWYESMGIMPVSVHYGTSVSGVDPFAAGAKWPATGAITHGHLAENNNHGGAAGAYPNVTGLPNGQNVTGSTVGITNFVTQFGDMSNSGSALNPPTVAQGQTFTFRNNDSTGNAFTDYIFHTITACASPCNRATGIAYPLANGPVDFDSGELGYGPSGLTPAEGRKTWNTPNNLSPGTYTYFCRIHPYMRGAFRVTAS